MLVNDTPVEPYLIRDTTVLVKREDLCAPLPGPSFSKMRGVYAHISQRPENVIGVLDTAHSKAGWAVAYACHSLGKQCVNYWPKYISFTEVKEQQRKAKEFGAMLIALKAGRSAILYHAAKKDLMARHPEAYIMPNALKINESVTENAAEAERTFKHLPQDGTLVISISSGTVASGILRAVPEAYDVVLHMGYSRSIEASLLYVEKMSGVRRPLKFVDEGYGYADATKVVAPFPCNEFYDAKAWAWLNKPGVVESLKQPVVMWNIGA